MCLGLVSCLIKYHHDSPIYSLTTDAWLSLYSTISQTLNSGEFFYKTLNSHFGAVSPFSMISIIQLFFPQKKLCFSDLTQICLKYHGLRTPSEERVFTVRPKINYHSQIFRHSRSIFCLPHWPKSSDFFHSCRHWVSVVRGRDLPTKKTRKNWVRRV